MWLSAIYDFLMIDLKEQHICFKVCFICRECCMGSAVSAPNSFQWHCMGGTDSWLAFSIQTYGSLGLRLLAFRLSVHRSGRWECGER